MGVEDVAAPLLGALQACVSVLLTICYGVLAQRLHFIRKTSIDDMAGLGVKVFLPALILVHLGEQLHPDNVLNYVPVLIWGAIYTCLSIGLAHIVSRFFNLPAWVTPACAFNNTTSLPLLLLQSLESVGSLNAIVPEGDTVQNAITRAQSYFLVCAVVSKTIGYAVGPKMLEIQNTDGPGEPEGRHASGSSQGASSQGEPEAESPADGGEQGTIDERTSLLPGPAHKAGHEARSKVRRGCDRIASFLPQRVKRELLAPFESPFADVMILCTVVGAAVGSVPQLHRAFFSPADHGGIFNAWLTSSIKNIGKLFTSLQIFIVGGKLGLSFERMSGSTRIPLKAILTIFLFRMVLWPAIGISVTYALARFTTVLQDDPILWFSMMLMPAGPPALVISGLAELAKIPETEEIQVAKTLTIMYALSPFVCFAITGSLKASEAVYHAKIL